MGLPIGQHLIISREVRTNDNPNGELIQRQYTPINTSNTKGELQLLIKIYRKNQNQKYPEGGKLTQSIEQL